MLPLLLCLHLKKRFPLAEMPGDERRRDGADVLDPEARPRLRTCTRHKRGRRNAVEHDPDDGVLRGGWVRREVEAVERRLEKRGVEFLREGAQFAVQLGGKNGARCGRGCAPGG